MANKKEKELGILLVLVMVLLTMTVGFALYATTLTIEGSVTVKGSPWNVHYESGEGKIVRTSGSKTPTQEVINTNDTNFAFTVTLDKPGDFYEVTVNAYNEGTIPAILKSITMTELTAAQQAYLSYTVTYDGTPYTATTTGLTDTLAAGGKKTVKIRVEYLAPAQQSALPSSDVTVSLSGSLLYQSE